MKAFFVMVAIALAANAAFSTSFASDARGDRARRTAAPEPNRGIATDVGGQTGFASYYREPQRLTSGLWFNPNALTAAHKTLPFGTRVRVTHLGNGRSVEVNINDRGPYVGGRIIDLSHAAARVIGMTGEGLARVMLEVPGRVGKR